VVLLVLSMLTRRKLWACRFTPCSTAALLAMLLFWTLFRACCVYIGLALSIAYPQEVAGTSLYFLLDSPRQPCSVGSGDMLSLRTPLRGWHLRILLVQLWAVLLRLSLGTLRPFRTQLGACPSAFRRMRVFSSMEKRHHDCDLPGYVQWRLSKRYLFGLRRRGLKPSVVGPVTHRNK
jgi:hypothetical protein